ncbi:MAG: IS1380 family transposase [Bacteroidota bacterium]
MLKIKTSPRKISPFSGISFVAHEIEKTGLAKIIDAAWPARHWRSSYSYSRAILALIYGTICGADRLDDYAVLRNKVFDDKIVLPSPVTLGRIMRQKLSVDNQKIDRFPINFNPTLSKLLLEIALHLNQIKPHTPYTLDYDNTILPCQKEDATFTYKKSVRGYQPGIAFIADIPVYIEGMAGNKPAAMDQVSTMKRCFELLQANNIKIARFRADNASYRAKLLELMENKGIEVFIRATNTLNLFEHITDTFHWDQITLGFTDTFEIASFDYIPFKSSNQTPYRIVTTRRPEKNGKKHKITGKPFIYRSILTNNTTLSNVEVYQFYNRRGAIERNFDVLGNDWNWHKLPFSFLNENTAFMIITAIGLITYKYIVQKFANRVDFVSMSDRLKRFRYNVISVAGEWKKNVLTIFDNSRHWEKLSG